MIIHQSHPLTTLFRAFGPAMLVGVVVLVQLLAPIGVVRFMAGAIADPVGAAPLCAAMAQPGPASDTAPTGHDAGCCVVCSLGFGGASAPTQPPQDFVVARFAQAVVWHLAVGSVIDARLFVHAQARAPPAAFA
ncbi:MAG: DUF2946 family protein [Pseudomonadota bacterium]